MIAVVSEYVAGPTLAERLSRPGPLDSRVSAQFVLTLADALEYAGRRLLVHGNLTPNHILTGEDGQPRISGFDLACLDCGPDISCATARVYVAPELVRSPALDRQPRPTSTAWA